jgi:epoxyqueuosine reductase QueG
MELSAFFEQNGVDDFSVVEVSALAAPKGFHPADILPSSKVLVLFGKVIPPFVFELEGKVKSSTLHQLICHMDSIAFCLSDRLRMEGHQSVPVPTFFPVRVHGGKLKGLLSLKHCAVAAGMGSLGLNTLLISERFGNRLCLSGVVSAAAIDCDDARVSKDLCRRCRKCIEACPTKAITDEGVQATRCVNFRHAVPRVMAPALTMAVKFKPAARLTEIMANTLGWSADMICSRCVTVCPHFRAGKDGSS